MTLFEKMENKTPTKTKKAPKSNELNTEIWADMTSDERSTYYIAEAYIKFMHNRGDKKKYLPSVRVKTVKYYDKEGDECYPFDHIRNHQNWKYFEKVWEEFKNDQLFEAEIFMESIAKHLPKASRLYPAQLATKKHIAGYKSYRNSIKLRSNEQDDDMKRILSGILQTYKLIQRRTGIQELDQQDLHAFFNKPKDNSILSEGLLCCMQEMISPYYFAVSKSFLRAYKDSDQDIRDEIIPLDRLKDMASLVRVKPRVYDFVKKIFGDDIL